MGLIWEGETDSKLFKQEKVDFGGRVEPLPEPRMCSGSPRLDAQLRGAAQCFCEVFLEHGTFPLMQRVFQVCFSYLRCSDSIWQRDDSRLVWESSAPGDLWLLTGQTGMLSCLSVGGQLLPCNCPVPTCTLS